MDGSAESPRLAAQRAAIQEARARYERGELSYETFRRALDALVMARDADECQTILRALPTSPLAPLAALESSPASAPAVAGAEPHEHHKWIVAFMSQIKKLRRPWQLQPSTDVVALMGEAKLDLRLAEMPAQARLRVTAIMGTVVILVPPTARVSVRSTFIMSDTHALGESISGVIAFGHDQHVPTTDPATTHLDIEIFALMGNVKVALANATRVEINELVRDALQAVAVGVRRGLRQGASQYPTLRPGGADPPTERHSAW